MRGAGAGRNYGYAKVGQVLELVDSWRGPRHLHRRLYRLARGRVRRAALRELRARREGWSAQQGPLLSTGMVGIIVGVAERDFAAAQAAAGARK